MSRKIVGVTVGTPISPDSMLGKLQAVKSVNGKKPDEDGNVTVEVSSGGGGIAVEYDEATGTVRVVSGKGSGTGSGSDGVGIADISLKEATDEGNVYNVYLTNGDVHEITAPKGEPGIQGANGNDGVSPAVSLSSFTGGTRVTITDAKGQHIFDVFNGKDGTGGSGGSGADGVGIQKIEPKAPTEAGNVYTVTLTDGRTYDITAPKGAQGEQGIQGVQGIQGIQGDKGDPGEKGDKGDQGIQGIQGEKGDPFTYADFTAAQLAALKGEKGDKGDTGEKGEKGDAGESYDDAFEVTSGSVASTVSANATCQYYLYSRKGILMAVLTVSVPLSETRKVYSFVIPTGIQKDMHNRFVPINDTLQIVAKKYALVGGSYDYSDYFLNLANVAVGWQKLDDGQRALTINVFPVENRKYDIDHSITLTYLTEEA